MSKRGVETKTAENHTRRCSLIFSLHLASLGIEGSRGLEMETAWVFEEYTRNVFSETPRNENTSEIQV
jgi:hypothetical protein